MVNASHFFTNEVGSALAAQCGTFGLVWRVGKGGVRCSLRSTRAYDVEALAKRFGGRGHPQSASFTLPLSALFELAAGRREPGRARAPNTPQL